MKQQKHILLLFSFLFSIHGNAQIDTLIDLPLVAVQSSRLPVNTNNSLQSEDFVNMNLAEIIEQQSVAFIKSNSLGGLATLSIRGGSSGHTTLLWNGIPVQSPMLGQNDISLFPSGFMEAAHIATGGQSAAWGSGAIAGTLQMNNLQQTKVSTLTANLSTGSFGFYSGLLKGGLNLRKNLFVRSRFLYQNANNDFSFRPHPSLPKQRQTNAAIHQKAFLQELFWQPAAKHQVNIFAWLQAFEKEIPPSIVQNASLASQTDDVIRIAGNWQYTGDRHHWQGRVAWFKEDIFFLNPIILLEAPSSFKTIFSELEYFKKLNNNWSFLLGGNHQNTRAHSTGYPDGRTENRIALFGKLEKSWSTDWSTKLSFRQPFVDTELLPFIPAIAIEKKVNHSIKVEAKVSKNYRYPTLNDRFWEPGGQPNLKPENGWSQEIDASFRVSKLRHEINFSLFNRSIDNWILWHPSSSGYWEAANLAKVWSRGLELQQNWHILSNSSHQLDFRLQYQYVKSTNEIANELPKIEKGNQLLYVPIHQAKGAINWTFHNFQVQYQQQYTSSYSSVSDPVDAYFLGHFSIQHKSSSPKNKILLYCHINNIWDTDYKVIERQARPGRYFRFGLQYTFTKPTTPPAL